MVEITNVSFSYGEGDRLQGLRDLSLNIKDGECVLLCGESGCGKTTVTRLINGLIPHFYEGQFSGKVISAGKDTALAGAAGLSQAVGSVFQNPRSQFFNLDTTSEIAFGCENNGLPPGEIRERVDKTVAALGIEALVDRDIFALSGGEKQLVALASVYALGPDIFVLDEPSSNLDAASCRDLAAQLFALKEAGKTIVIAEHRLYYLAGLFDRVVYLKDGMISHEWGAEEFAALSEEQRSSLGLRSLSLEGLLPPEHSPAPVPPELRVSRLEAAYRGGGRKNSVLKGISFEAAPGEIIGIIGKNGAGKSSLAGVLCGLRRESAGEIRLGGKSLPPARRAGQFYLVMQESSYQLFTDSVEHELYLSKDRKSRPPETKVEAVIESLGLAPFRERHPMSLSGGQKQRTAIGTAMAHEAAVLVFDEPSSGLDYRNMRRVASVMEELRRQGRIVFIITHDYELLLAACSRVMILEDGRITGDMDLRADSLALVRSLWK